MRSLLMFLGVVAVAWFAMRMLGSDDDGGNGGQHPKLAAASTSATEGPPEDAPVVVMAASDLEPAEESAIADPSPAGHMVPEGDEAAQPSTTLRAAVTALAKGTTSDLDAVQQIARGGSGEERELAGAVLAAFGTDAIERRNGIQRVYEAGLVSGEEREELRNRLYGANEETVLSRRSPVASEYTVQAGDSLWKICQRLRTDTGVALEPGLLKFLNKLRGDQIRVGQVLRIPIAQPRVQISKASFRLRIYLGEALLREYEVGLGKDDRTPAGTFRVATRLIQPPWRNPETGRMVYPGDPEYAIGTRWIGFDDASGSRTDLGIHGTNEPESIGKAESLGCVRMRNDEVEELFDLLPAGAVVDIVDAAWPGF